MTIAVEKAAETFEDVANDFNLAKEVKEDSRNSSRTHMSMMEPLEVPGRK